MVAVGFGIFCEKNADPARFCVFVKKMCVKHSENNREERKVAQLFKKFAVQNVNFRVYTTTGSSKYEPKIVQKMGQLLKGKQSNN